LLVGAGGLGSPIAMYLAACGVGIIVSPTVDKWTASFIKLGAHIF